MVNVFPLLARENRKLEWKNKRKQETKLRKTYKEGKGNFL